MDENFNKDLHEFEENLKKAIVKDERENIEFTKDFLEKMKSESNFRELERRRIARKIYLNVTLFISLIVLVTLGFNEFIRSCNQATEKAKSTQTTSSLPLMNLYVIGLEQINSHKLIENIRSILNPKFHYQLKLYTIENINPIMIDIDSLSNDKLQYKHVEWKDVGYLMKSAFYDIPRDSIAYHKVLLLGNFPLQWDNKLKKGLFTTNDDFQQLIRSQSIELIHIVEKEITPLSSSFHQKIEQLSNDNIKTNINNKLTYLLIKL